MEPKYRTFSYFTSGCHPINIFSAILQWKVFSMLRDCSYVLLVLFRLYGQRNRSYYTREIEDTILLALQKPEVYDDIARATCCKFGIDRPQVVPVQGLPQSLNHTYGMHVKGKDEMELKF
ncbi:hypothetical protein Zm00014a_030583 [Zea mays]|uniref:Uncharacterized protein n=1 Tax=Zea mays TaxID=4577 RepID=A0A3L6DFA4_MAIZE|nr:hypothetical protein Zm00014a_030583 [Zea mays]